VGPLRAVGNSWRLLRGWRVAMRMARRRRPAAVLTTGGYVSVPVALAVRSLGIPLLVYLPDIEPALSVKFVSRLAPRVAVTVEGSKAYLTEDKVTVTGYPLGERVRRWDRESGRGALGLPRQARVLLVFGGSRGARSINRAVVAHLEELLRMAEVVHVTGHLDWEEVVAARGELSSSQVERYHPFPYLHEEMGAALAAADLVVSRAGASVLGEFPYFGLPAVLVPYPYAWRYQRVNAAWLAERAAAVVVEDEALAEALVPTVRELLEGEERRAAMATSARELARPHAATHIAEALLALGKGR
jgi:UDP-N-acetylglucosamine--N-acetylmuramyl-(pentapeptide) pyrophosphoryl-undecaprenol N-acetylglucosamine transferase